VNFIEYFRMKDEGEPGGKRRGTNKEGVQDSAV